MGQDVCSGARNLGSNPVSLYLLVARIRHINFGEPISSLKIGDIIELFVGVLVVFAVRFTDS